MHNPGLAAGRAAASGDTERRQLTVLFADMVGSTSLVEKLGAERYAEVLRAYHSICTEATRHQNGTVAEYLGDGVVSYFGYPQAQEDDAVRAAEAVFEILKTLENIGATREGVRLATRIGVATGEVVVNNADGDYYGRNAIGACLSKAARLQGAAEHGQAVFCDVTRKLVGQWFEFDEVGPLTLKGFETPERAHTMRLRRNRGLSRFEALRGQRHAPLFGRAAEIERLVTALAAAREGHGSGLIVRGEPGIGKSRLIQAFRKHPGTETARVITLQCSPLHSNTALHPMRDYLEWIAGAQAGESAEVRRARLERLFRTTWGVTDEQLPALLEVLGPAVGPPGADADDQSVPARRAQVFNALAKRLFDIGSKSQPVVLLFEDVHWIDPSSIEVLRLIFSQAHAHPALVIATTRPEGAFDAPLDGVARIDLAGLDAADCQALARALGEAAGLDQTRLDLIVDKSDGVPLFVEEYAQMLAEHGGHPASDVPVTLTGLLQGKIDRLPPEARRLAQAGATIGREFGVALAAAVADVPPPAEDEVDALGRADLARPDTRPGTTTRCVFKHALVRDAVYGSLNRNLRRSLHGGIADRMLAEGVTPGMEEVLADHLAGAERFAESLDMRFAAALAAVGSGSAVEALAHLEKGLALLLELPDGNARDSLELKLRAVQGPTLMVTRGPGNPAFGAAQARALELMNALGVAGPVFPVTYNCALHAWASGRLDEADAVIGRLFELHDRRPNDAAFMGAHTMRGLVAWHRGHNADALEHMAATAARYDPARHAPLYADFLKDFGVFSHFYKGLAHCVLGEVDAATVEAAAARELAKRVRHPHEFGFSLLASFLPAMLAGDVDTAAEYALQSLQYSGAQGFPEFVAMSQVCSGWVATKRGQLEAGLAEMEAGAAFWAMTGFEVWQVLFACVIAEANIAAGRLERAQEVLDAHARRLAAMGEQQFAAPLAWVRAKLYAAQGRHVAAEHSRQLARVVAEEQGARLWLAVPGALFQFR